ncbi:protein sym-1 isoform X2 [Primulina eburnea]|uniref:protein sym-1 isoform X2 n=1 Tax=Primulina eburnea TaxID=1245227 RepID=UPI003C6C091F
MSCSIQATITRKYHILFRSGDFSSPPIINLGTRTKVPVFDTIRVNGSCRIRSSADGLRLFTRPHFGFGHLCLRSLWVSSGGAGGGSGGSGDGSSGNGDGSSGGGGGRESNWSFLSWYLSLLAKYPVMTKAVTSSFLNLVGDVICQLVIDQVPSLDLKRTFLFAFLGLVLVGPALHFWYLFLSKWITAPGASGALLRLVLDQFLFSPIFIGTFLAALVTLEGRPSLVIPKLRQEWFSSVLANWQLWIPFQFLNFRFVPQQFQVLAANFIALIWNVILSYKAHQEVAGQIGR